MFKSAVNFVQQAFKTPDVRNRIIFTFSILAVFRLLAAIPLPAIDVTNLSSVTGSSPFASVFTLVTGGRLDSPTLVAIGLGAYINASIIIQLLTAVIPQLEELQKDGERGRMILNQYTRYLAVPLSFLQAFVIFTIIKSTFPQLIGDPTRLEISAMLCSLTAGSIILMWLSELLTEKGIGNGSSFIIFAGILSSLPGLVKSDLNILNQGNNTNLIIGIIIGGLAIILAIVFMNEAIRKIPIQYARRVRGSKLLGGGSSYLPLKINNAGVMPIIFAISLVTFPQVIADFLVNLADSSSQLYNISLNISNFYKDNNSLWIYNSIYFVVIIIFTFFYTFIAVKPSERAEDLKKHGGFIPGIRPGKMTERFLRDVLIRLTFVGALFLATIAIIPSVVSRETQLAIFSGIGGTSILIIVGVVLDTIRQMKSMMVTRNYEAYI